jgi:hypothetical protein
MQLKVEVGEKGLSSSSEQEENKSPKDKNR